MAVSPAGGPFTRRLPVRARAPAKRSAPDATSCGCVWLAPKAGSSSSGLRRAMLRLPKTKSPSYLSTRAGNILSRELRVSGHNLNTQLFAA